MINTLIQGKDSGVTDEQEKELPRPAPPPPIWLKKGSSRHACSDTSLRWLCSHLGSLVSHPLPLISPKCQKQLAWYYRDIGQQTQNTVVTKYTDGFVNIKYGDKQPKKPHIYFL